MVSALFRPSMLKVMIGRKLAGTNRISAVRLRARPRLMESRRGLYRVQPQRGHTSFWPRSEEHTSELQSQSNLVCRLLLEKKIYSKCHIVALVWHGVVQATRGPPCTL